MAQHSITRPQNVDYFRVPRPLWRRIKKHLPKPPQRKARGVRVSIIGPWSMASGTCCGPAASGKQCIGIGSACRAASCTNGSRRGNAQASGKRFCHFGALLRSPTSRGLAVASDRQQVLCGPVGRGSDRQQLHGSGQAGQQDPHSGGCTASTVGDSRDGSQSTRQWSADDLIFAIVVRRPTTRQHLCADKGYDYADVHQVLHDEHYIPHIKHRRRRGEPLVEECPIPVEVRYPARRWVVGRTLSWLVKRRSLKIRWCKKPENWLAFLHFACADILCSMAISG